MSIKIEKLNEILDDGWRVLTVGSNEDDESEAPALIIGKTRVHGGKVSFGNMKPLGKDDNRVEEDPK